MSKIIFGTTLFIALIAAGCSNSQLHQSLLMHENRQLENALYAAHAQVADLKRENNALRGQQAGEFHEAPRRSRNDSWDEDWNNFIEMPSVILPEEPGTTELPDFLRGSQTLPTWSPRR